MMIERYMEILEFIRPYPYMPLDKIHTAFFADVKQKVAREFVKKMTDRGYLKKLTIRIRRETIEVFVDVWALTEFGKEWLTRQINNGHATSTARQLKNLDQESVTE